MALCSGRVSLSPVCVELIVTVCRILFIVFKDSKSVQGAVPTHSLARTHLQQHVYVQELVHKCMDLYFAILVNLLISLNCDFCVQLQT